MATIAVLLSSIKCGRCKNSLIHRFESDGMVKYTCFCAQKIRTILICTACKKQFLNLPYLVRKTNYCSLKCYWTSTNKKQLKNCRSCSKEFYADNSLLEKGYGFYCSRDCWFSIFQGWKHKVKCKQCSKSFSVIRAVYKKKPKYCSKECKDDSEKDRIMCICRGCNKEFEILRYLVVNRGRGLFCSWKCFKKYRGESSLELLIRQQLEKLNEPFQQEMRIGKFRADFYLPKRNLIIECDGEYWHMSEKVRLRDQRKDKFLEELGYNILRLSGQDIIDSNFALKTFFVK